MDRRFDSIERGFDELEDAIHAAGSKYIRWMLVSHVLLLAEIGTAWGLFSAL